MAEMMRLSPEDVLKRHDTALRKKDDFRDLYEDAYEFALPQRNLYDGYWEGKVGGAKKMNRVFDSTAINSTQRFANRLQSGIFPPQRKWARLEPGPDIPDDRKGEAQAALDIYTEKFFATLKQSNFDIAMGEFLLDLSVGTAVMMVQPGDDVSPLNFVPVPQYLVAFEEGANGQVDNVYRRMRIKGEAIQRQWTDAKIEGQLKTKIENKPTDDYEFIEATVFDMKRGDYCYLVLKNASLAIAGVYTAADDGVLNPNTIKIVPGAIIPVARNGGPQGESLKALPRSADFNVSQIVINDLVQNIKRILLDESLPPDNMSARSATEVVERMKELSQNLGSAFGRLINETMIPLVTKILEVMDQRGIITMPLRVNGLEIKVSAVAPLAMAQNMEEVSNILQYAQIAAGAGPEGQMIVKIGDMLDIIAEKLAVPQSIRMTKAEREAKMAEAQDMAEQAAQMAQENPDAAAQLVGGMA